MQGDRIIAGCHGGGCGVCRIRVIAGSYATKAMNEVHISPDDRKRGIVLACRTFPSSDLDIEVLGRRAFAPAPKLKRRDAAPGVPPDRCP